MNAQDFFRKHPKLAGLKKRYRRAFLVLSRCMPPRSAQISKTELNRRAKRVNASWALLSKQTHSERIATLIEYELFTADHAEPQFVCVSEIGDQYRRIIEVAEKNGSLPSAAQEDSSPDAADV